MNCLGYQTLGAMTKRICGLHGYFSYFSLSMAIPFQSRFLKQTMNQQLKKKKRFLRKAGQWL